MHTYQKFEFTFFFRISDRPESSLTVASECSSTISSEEEAETGGPSVPSGSNPNPKPVVPERSPPKAPPSPTNSSISDDDLDGDTWNTPTNQSTPIKDLSQSGVNTPASMETVKSEEMPKKGNGGRLANLLNTMKIPKFKLKNSSSKSASEPSSLENTPAKRPPQPQPRPGTFSRSNSNMSSDAGAGSSFVRNTKVSRFFSLECNQGLLCSGNADECQSHGASRASKKS